MSQTRRLACGHNSKQRRKMSALRCSSQTKSDSSTCVRSQPQAPKNDVRAEFRRRTFSRLNQTRVSSAPELEQAPQVRPSTEVTALTADCLFREALSEIHTFGFLIGGWVFSFQGSFKRNTNFWVFDWRFGFCSPSLFGVKL